MNSKGQFVDAEDILDQVRRQLRREVFLPGRNSAVRLYSGATRRRRASGAKAGAPGTSEDFEEIIQRLQALYTSAGSDFAASVAQIGEMPPPRPTVRGLFGRVSIWGLQRLLWWYTRSLHHFAESVGGHLHDTTEALESLALMQEANRIEVAALREEVRRLRESLASGPAGGR